MENEFIFQFFSERELSIQSKIIKTLGINYPELAQEAQRRIKEVQKEARLKITFVGQHNAGKSTIVSALTRNKSIKISSNVETDDTASYEWGDVLLFDTPGLYAGVRETHDAAAMEAIKNSDILVFCITASLFDDLLIANYIDLAYRRAYKNKIVLVVNKMSMEDASYEELKTNYMETLTSSLSEFGGNLADFPISFIDAKDYKDGIEEDDEELIDISHFDDFISLLNQQIVSKGLLAKIGTKCNILIDSIEEAIASTGTEIDQNMVIVLQRAKKTIRRYQKDMRCELESLEMELRGEILGIGREIIDKIGQSEITEEDEESINNKIIKISEEYVGKIEERLSERMTEMHEDIASILSTEMGCYLFQKIAIDSVNVDAGYYKDYSSFVEKYAGISDLIKKSGASVANLALKEGATSLGKLASSSGSQLHATVLKVGHLFGTKFKPWQAVKIANKIGKVAKLAGPLMVGVDVIVTTASKINEEKRIKKIQREREKASNIISGVASEIINKINKQYELMEKEVFEGPIAEIDGILNQMTMENAKNNECVKTLREYAEELKVLINSFSTC